MKFWELMFYLIATASLSYGSYHVGYNYGRVQGAREVALFIEAHRRVK